MATQYFGINRGGQLKDVARGTTTTAKAVEVAINDAAGLSTLDTVSLISTLQQFIYNLRYGIAGVAPPTIPIGVDSLFVRPTAQGNQNGRTWEDALALKDVPGLLTSLSPNGHLYIAAWDGPYTINSSVNRLLLSRPAYAGPATIRGANVDLTPAKATINGTRHAYNGVNYQRSSDPQNDGYDVFQVDDGATNLTLQHFTMNNIGWGVNAIGSATNLHLTDMDFNNVNCGITNILNITGGSSKANTLQFPGFVIQRMTFTGYEIAAIKIGQIFGAAPVLVEDCTGDALYYVGNNNSFQEGLHVRGTGAAVVNRCRFDNSIWTGPSTSYWNGDGFATEAEVTSIIYTDCRAEGNSDAGFDDKAHAITRIRCIARNNKIAYRNWSLSTIMEDCESHLPHKLGGPNEPEHIQFNKVGAVLGEVHTATLNRMIITGDATHEAEIIHVTATFNTGDTLTINWNDYDIDVDANTPLYEESDGLHITPVVNWNSAAAGKPTANPGTNRMNP